MSENGELRLKKHSEGSLRGNRLRKKNGLIEELKEDKRKKVVLWTSRLGHFELGTFPFLNVLFHSLLTYEHYFVVQFGYQKFLGYFG